MSRIAKVRIDELSKYHFYIPSYQRGYRWEEKQVTDLLNDIAKFFSPPATDEREDWYCLQPVIIKKEGQHHHVLDGQQRLTTIYLVLKFLELSHREELGIFTIEFQTRNTPTANSSEFLQNIAVKTLTEAEVNIDYFHIYHAYHAIATWFNENKHENFLTWFLTRTKVIWYEVDEQIDSIELFTRVNVGKIPLTDAELIKALLLNSANFQTSDNEKLRLRQLEIATEWERMEYALQEPSFWAFINSPKNTTPVRIEFIFEAFMKLKGSMGTGSHPTYNFFERELQASTNVEKNAGAAIDKIWGEVKAVFMTLEEWYADKTLYHTIGFLITIDYDLVEILKEARKKTKKEFESHVNAQIKKQIACEDLTRLFYGASNDLIKRILLYHNIHTTLSNRNEFSRFPFHQYKKSDWDIEHIHASATEMPVMKKHRIDWLTTAEEFIGNEELRTKVKSLIHNYDAEVEDQPDYFRQVFLEVLNDRTLTGNEKYEEIMDISNLALLDSGTNRSYKNAVFPSKRKEIIKREVSGTFIPICTRNVFMKFYSEDGVNMMRWNEKDRAAYLKNISDLLYNGENSKEKI